MYILAKLSRPGVPYFKIIKVIYLEKYVFSKVP